MKHIRIFSYIITLSVFYLACSDSKLVTETSGVVTDKYHVDKEGRRNGEFKRFFGSDTLAEVSNYVHGLLQGERTIYNTKGAREIVEHYVNDTLQGPYQVFYENGDVKIEGEYFDGVMKGVWKRYYPGGKPLEEVTYDENLENGPFTEYYENGNLKAKGQYQDGDFEQDSLYLYNESGILIRKMFCEHGVCNTCWLAEGEKED